MTHTEKVNRILEIIKGLEPENKIGLHNEYCQLSKETYRTIHEMNEIDNVLGGFTPRFILEHSLHSDFDIDHDYFMMDEYECLQSFYEHEVDNFVDLNKIAEYLAERTHKEA